MVGSVGAGREWSCSFGGRKVGRFEILDWRLADIGVGWGVDYVELEEKRSLASYVMFLRENRTFRKYSTFKDRCNHLS